MVPQRFAPHAGAWIETGQHALCECATAVAPHAGAWMKRVVTAIAHFLLGAVAPHAGAWIETVASSGVIASLQVAPHAGEWIETSMSAAPCILGVRRAPRGRVD